MSFGDLKPAATDPVLGLMSRFRADGRARKIDLGVGVYRDAAGNTPVFAAVKAAEHRLATDQTTKAYLGAEGDPEFVSLLATAVFGEAYVSSDGRSALAGLQTVGGTGALRLAAELLSRTRPGRRIWLSLPTWPNHVPLFTAAGLEVHGVEGFDAAAQHPRTEALLHALAGAAPGDAVLLHGCGHNPTGLDPDSSFWEHIAAEIAARGLIPLIDMAYQGLGRGWSEDGAAMRRLAALPNVLVAYSCDKNFGLYRERVGALFVAGSSPSETQALLSHLIALARTSYSMPPDHGAAVVRVILEDPALTRLWRGELDVMQTRLRSLRTTLATHGRVGAVELGSLADGNGLFALLPLLPGQIELLQTDHGIYLPPSGRINIAGLAEQHVERFVAALGAVQLKLAA
jgi:aromatic-amino-acid transaminase